nr:hypothetical protein [Tanacetum cinerariifolium]
MMKVKSLKAWLLLKETDAIEAIHLYARVSASKVTEKKHASEIDALKQKNVALKNDKGFLDGKVVKLQSLVSTKDLELKELNAVHELEVTCSSLREQISGYENLTDRLEEFQDAQLKVVNDKVAKLDADLAEMACHLEEKFYPHLFTTISGLKWLLTHGLKLVLIKCLNSSEYLTTLGAAISRSIEKGMQDADINSALQELYELDCPLLVELKSHKDASVEDIMNLLILEGPLADAPGMGDLQPDTEQLKVPIHISKDQNLIGEVSTFASIPAATTMTLSTTYASASSIPPNTVNDYEIVNEDGQESPQGNVQGDAATVEFKKEDLDTTPECDLLS